MTSSQKAKNIEVPLTSRERLEAYKEINQSEVVMPHPDSKVWYDKDLNNSSQDKLIWATPYDARFPQQRIQRKCFSYYVDYFRCKELMGEDYKPCKFFSNVYRDVCPKFWIDKWDELREDSRFPAVLDR